MRIGRRLRVSRQLLSKQLQFFSIWKTAIFVESLGSKLHRMSVISLSTIDQLRLMIPTIFNWSSVIPGS
jgi:hypothetical protein